jgi:hypothetical protein
MWGGFAHGSKWNGFDKVAISKDTLEQIIAWLQADGSPTPWTVFVVGLTMTIVQGGDRN